MTKTVICLASAALIAGCATRPHTRNSLGAPEEVRKSFSFGYWKNGWRKTADDKSPDVLAYETGIYGFELDMDDLSQARFGLIDDDSDYHTALIAGVNRMDTLRSRPLAIELEMDSKTYTATTCKSGVDLGVQRLKSTRLWESGRFVQNFDLQNLVLQDVNGEKLDCYGNLRLVAWPESLTMIAELAPDFAYANGPTVGVAGNGLCVVDKPLDIPHSPKLEPETLTLECWVNIPAKLNSRAHGWLVCKNDNEWAEGNYGFMLTAEAVQAVLNIGGGGKNYKTIKQRGKLAVGEWHHLVMTYDGVTMRFYLNGDLQGQEELGRTRVPGKGNLRIGQRADGVTHGKPAPVISGLYDQVRVWSRPLSDQEITAHAGKPAKLATRNGLVFERNFEEGPEAKEPVWTDATLRVRFDTWQAEKRVAGAWKVKQNTQIILTCDVTGGAVSDSPASISVESMLKQAFPVTFNPAKNCFEARINELKRSWERLPRADGGTADNYDEFLIKIENNSATTTRIPFQLRLPHVPAITGLVPLLCKEDGTPTGIPVQLSKNWHNPEHDGLFAYTLLPAKPGLGTYKLRIVYGFYGAIPSASHSQLSLVGWGGNGRWDQLAIGSWGETFCLDMDMSPTNVAITDVRGLYLRNGKDGDKWGWSDGGWGGDWLGIRNDKDEKLAFSQMKTAYLAHGPCLTDVHYDGAYGSGPAVDLAATVRVPRVDDHARTFNTLRYTFNEEVSTKGAWLYKMGGGWFVSPKIAYGNRDGLIAEHDVPQTGLNPGDVLRPPVTLAGDGPWWVAYPGGHIGDGRTWGTGSRALIIRGYRASFGGQVIENPTIAFPVNDRKFEEGQTDINLLLVPPTNVAAFLPGDYVELDTEWIVVPRVADDYYGPNETFRKHLEEHPRSWRTVHRAAVGNNLEINISGGELKRQHPIIIETTKPEVTVDIKGGLGYVPIRFDGLATADGYALYEVVDGEEQPLDQSRHGNDFWQTDYETSTGAYRMTFNIPLDDKPTSRWVLRQGDR